jgi:hypothetical protein
VFWTVKLGHSFTVQKRPNIQKKISKLKKHSNGMKSRIYTELVDYKFHKQNITIVFHNVIFFKSQSKDCNPANV